MLTRNKIKHIQSLSRKKFRDISQLFVAEGLKTITELKYAGYTFETIICTSEYTDLFSNDRYELIIAPAEDIKKVSFLNTPQPIVALVKMKTAQPIVLTPTSDLCMALDEIQDPGNLGTIIRLCSWFGIKNLVCSTNTVDCYNPKVVQATMGAIAHVNVWYTNLDDFLKNATNLNFPIYGTFLEGANIYEQSLTKNGIIVLGNEGNGISPSIEKLITEKLFIPPYRKSDKVIESLNVSMAASIICSEFRRGFY